LYDSHKPHNPNLGIEPKAKQRKPFYCEKKNFF
jgi:hypothetical protein